MDKLTAGIGEFVISGKPNEILRTYALGSCVAVIIRDPQLKTTGLLHVALPDSDVSKEKAQSMPAYFADLGVPLMVQELKRAGIRGNGPRLTVKITGGANVNDRAGVFDIGKRNILAVKQALWKLGMGPLAEDTGGTISRTVSVNVGTGTVRITSAKRKNMEI